MNTSRFQIPDANMSFFCLPAIWKTAFESGSRDFSSFKNFVIPVTNLCQGQWKLNRENTKLQEPERNCPFQNHFLTSSQLLLYLAVKQNAILTKLSFLGRAKNNKYILQGVSLIIIIFIEITQWLEWCDQLLQNANSY